MDSNNNNNNGQTTTITTTTTNTSFNAPATHYEHFLQATGHPFTYTGVSPPLALTSTYNFPLAHDQYHTPHDPHTYFYSRSQNPNFSFLSQQLCALHGGNECVVFASGMAAISATLFSLVLKNKRNTIVYSNELYHDGSDLLEEMKEMCNIHTIEVDILQTDNVIEKASQEGVSALFFDSSSNPNNKVPDFEQIISSVRTRNPTCLFIVDNTFLSPALFRPFEVGIDIVIESGTKYLSGKGDALLGAVIVKFRPDEYGPTKYVARRLQKWRSMTGGSPSPMSCWLVSKGLETLQLRMDHIFNNTPLLFPIIDFFNSTTLEVAKFLETVPCVSRVLFAGLKSHPTYDLALRYFQSPEKCGGVLRFHLPFNMFSEPVSYSRILVYLVFDQYKEFCADVAPFVLAVSFGEAHTLICPPYDGYTHVFHDDQDRNIAKLPGYWVRVAIGLQSADEIKRGFLHLFARKRSLHRVVGSVIAVDGHFVKPDPKDKSQKLLTVNTSSPFHPTSKIPTPSTSPSTPTYKSKPNATATTTYDNANANNNAQHTSTSTDSTHPNSTTPVLSDSPTATRNPRSATPPPNLVYPTPISTITTPETESLVGNVDVITKAYAAAQHAAANAEHAASNAAQNAELAAQIAVANANTAAEISAVRANTAAQISATNADAAAQIYAANAEVAAQASVFNATLAQSAAAHADAVASGETDTTTTVTTAVASHSDEPLPSVHASPPRITSSNGAYAHNEEPSVEKFPEALHLPPSTSPPSPPTPKVTLQTYSPSSSSSSNNPIPSQPAVQSSSAAANRVHQLLIDDTADPNQDPPFSPSDIVFLFNAKSKKVIFVDLVDVQKHRIPEKKKLFSFKEKPKKSQWIVNITSDFQQVSKFDDFELCKLLTAEVVHKIQFKAK